MLQSPTAFLDSQLCRTGRAPWMPLIWKLKNLSFWRKRSLPWGHITHEWLWCQFRAIYIYPALFSPASPRKFLYLFLTYVYLHYNQLKHDLATYPFGTVLWEFNRWNYIPELSHYSLSNCLWNFLLIQGQGKVNLVRGIQFSLINISLSL